MSDTLANEDLAHPIPRLDVIDVHGLLKAGGSDLVVVIASPLCADDYSQRRLLRKLANYAAFVGAADFAEQFGKPTPESTTIVVNIHVGSAPEIFRTLEAWRPNALVARASFRVELLQPGE